MILLHQKLVKVCLDVDRQKTIQQGLSLGVGVEPVRCMIRIDAGELRTDIRCENIVLVRSPKDREIVEIQRVEVCRQPQAGSAELSLEPGCRR